MLPGAGLLIKLQPNPRVGRFTGVVALHDSLSSERFEFPEASHGYRVAFFLSSETNASRVDIDEGESRVTTFSPWWHT